MTIDNDRTNTLIQELRAFLGDKEWLISAESLMALLTVAAELCLEQTDTPMPRAVFVKQAERCWDMVKAQPASLEGPN